MSSRDEESQYARTTFLERVAHELRGPAGVIAGAMHELEVALGDEAEKHAALFSIAKRGVRRIVRSADRLQQTGQLERGDVPMYRERCDVSALCESAIADAQAVENRRAITVEANIPKEPVLAAIDPRWIGVAIYELTSNAIRHASKLVNVELRVSDASVSVVVTDDNSHEATVAPSRFRSTREARGLGLALSIVDDVAREHGGKLEIVRADKSAGQSGTTVSLVLPRALEALEGGETKAPAAKQAQGGPDSKVMRSESGLRP